MPKALTAYGLSSEEFSGLVLEDPALFDTYVIRMIEDVDLAAQVAAPLISSGPQIDVQAIFGALSAFRRINGGEYLGLRDLPPGIAPLLLEGDGLFPDTPAEFRIGIDSLVRDYVRGPISYEAPALRLVGNVVAAAAYDVLSTGAGQARQDGTDTVKLRHWLPGCEGWFYPLNRFC